MKIRILFIALLIFLNSCEKDKDGGSKLQFQAVSGSICVSNEGNFQSGNSSITNYDPATGQSVHDVYKTANNQALGDICQSMNVINDKLYLVVNNSGKIEVCDTKTMTKTATISGFTSPRYILKVDNTKAYVTDGYANMISIVNLTNNTITGSIPMNGFAEQMIAMNNKVYVTNTSSEYLYVIDTTTDAINDSILIGKGANSIRADINGKIWVLCSGDYLLTYNGALFRIDPVTKNIEANIPFQANEFPWRLNINGAKDMLYFLNTNVWRMSVSDNALPANPFITPSGNNFYGLGIDATRNEIYVSDAIDYIQNGRVYRFNSNGTEISNFSAGIIPGDFLVLP